MSKKIEGIGAYVAVTIGTIAIAIAFAKTANGMLGTPVHIIDVDDEEEIITVGAHAH